MAADGAGGFYLTVVDSPIGLDPPGGVVHFVPGTGATPVTDLDAFFVPFDVAVVPVAEPARAWLLGVGCAAWAIASRRPSLRRSEATRSQG